MKVFSRQFAAVFCITSFFHHALFAQDANVSYPELMPNRPAEYYFRSDPKQELISIRVMGAARKPGLYHVPEGLDLYTLVSLASGLNTTADVEGITLLTKTRTNTLKRYQIDLSQMLEKATPPMTLKKDDILYIPEKERIISPDAAQIISIVSIALSTILTSIVISERM